MKSRMRFAEVFSVGFFTFSLLLSFSQIQAAEDLSELWWSIEQATANSELQAKSSKVLDNHLYEDAHLMKLNEHLMRNLLNLNHSNADVSAKGLASSKTYQISVPLPNGSIVELSLVKDSVLPEKLAAKYPEINTYRVLANDRVFSGKVDISPAGFHAMLQMLDGEVIFIDPIELSKSEYAVFNKSAQKTNSHRQHSCEIHKDPTHNDESDIQRNLSFAKPAARNLEFNETPSARSQESIKNYTIAVATTGEYSAKFGGSVSGTLAAISTTINRINQVLERDLGIHLSLAENNDLLINTDASSDPFTGSKLIDLVFENQTFIDNTIGSANYDLGHLFTTQGGGLAAIASVCNSNNKAKAASGTISPRGDSFDLDFVAHEIGHQLGATHTFNSTQGACSVETRTARSAFEPGSGSSIMSYAGYCGLDNIQSNTDAMYHIGSIKQIANYTNNGVGNRCGVVTSTQNTPPIVDAGRNYIIPARTPFELNGTAVDEDGDSLIYAWEQLDAGDISTEDSDKGNNALFRVHAPNANKSRSFPPLGNLLNNTNAKGETLPSYQRNLTMSFVAQDGFNVAQSDEMTIRVVRTGSRFALNYPRAQYTRGDTYPIFWNVANTDITPINCASVNVLLSIDGGQNFNLPVANNIPNNGETLITIPADASISAQGRFKIKCSDNIFFAVSYRNFFVTQNDDSVTVSYPNEDQAETNLKDVALNSSPATSSTGFVDNSNDSFNSGGGVFDFAAYLLLLLLIFIRELTSRYRVKNSNKKTDFSF